jgi:hypothetical protein
MTTLMIPVTTEPDTLPGNCIPVQADGVLSRVRRTCTAHRAEAYCVAREVDVERLVYWCAEGRHHMTRA